jgi:hypothetical protein
VNQDRTLEMEKEVFAKMKAFSNPANRQETSIATLKWTLDQFNGFHAKFGDANFAAKIEILNQGLKDLGYGGINMGYEEGVDNYDKDRAASNRADSLNKLHPNDYVGTILPQGAAPLPEAKK